MIETEILIAEIIGIIAFAISGAVLAIKKRFDIFGVIILGVMTAVGGGALRDIILNVTPPVMFQNPLYTVIALCTSVFVFILALVFGNKLNKKNLLNLINFFDAIGLGVFAVTGADAAIKCGFEHHAFLVIFVGVLTGIGGGMVRDILAGKIPFVLYKDIYASAAIVGSVLYYFLYMNGIERQIAVLSAILSTIIIRMAAILYGLRLPHAADSKLLSGNNKNKIGH